MNSNYIKQREFTNNRNRNDYNVEYITNSIRRSDNSHVISGYFPKKNSVKAMAIKKVNTTLCCLLLAAIFISAISYFFVVSSEIKLNECSRKTTMLNVENAELENKLDKLKSFNNVDLTMQKNNLLQRPEKVIEATEINVAVQNDSKIQKIKPKAKAWVIGY